MPNRQAPSPEEALQLFKKYPEKLLREWADEWGVSVERVRQIRHESGIGAVFKINYEVVEKVATRIESGQFTLTSREMYKDLPVSYDAFATWLRDDIDSAQRINQAQEKRKYAKLDPSKKICSICKDNLDINKFPKSQKYADGHHKFCFNCLLEIKDNKPKNTIYRKCLMCKKEKSNKSFDSRSNFCKICKSKNRRAKRARDLKTQ
jgi:hypothetical protein